MPLEVAHACPPSDQCAGSDAAHAWMDIGFIATATSSGPSWSSKRYARYVNYRVNVCILKQRDLEFVSSSFKRLFSGTPNRKAVNILKSTRYKHRQLCFEGNIYNMLDLETAQ